MSGIRKIIGHSLQDGKGPHLALPAGFTPLRLTLVEMNSEVEIVSPIAIVGRQTDVDLRLAFADVSRRHCQFVFEDGLWRVIDLRSLNGVFVNNQRVVDVPIYAGDQVRVGCVNMLVLAATIVQHVQHEHDKLQQIADALPAA